MRGTAHVDERNVCVRSAPPGGVVDLSRKSTLNRRQSRLRCLPWARIALSTAGRRVVARSGREVRPRAADRPRPRGPARPAAPRAEVVSAGGGPAVAAALERRVSRSLSVRKAHSPGRRQPCSVMPAKPTRCKAATRRPRASHLRTRRGPAAWTVAVCWWRCPPPPAAGKVEEHGSQQARGAHSADLPVAPLLQHEAQRGQPLAALDDARQRRRRQRLGAPVALRHRRDRHAGREPRDLRVARARVRAHDVVLALPLRRAQQPCPGRTRTPSGHAAAGGGPCV